MALALRAGRLTGGSVPTGRPVPRVADRTKVPIPDDLAQASAPCRFTPAQGEKRGRVALLSGCVMRVLYGPVHHATVNVLAANGIKVVCPPSSVAAAHSRGIKAVWTTPNKWRAPSSRFLKTKPWTPSFSIRRVAVHSSKIMGICSRTSRNGPNGRRSFRRKSRILRNICTNWGRAR